MGTIKAIAYTAKDAWYSLNEGIADDRATRNYISAIANSARFVLSPDSLTETFKYARSL